MMKLSKISISDMMMNRTKYSVYIIMDMNQMIKAVHMAHRCSTLLPAYPRLLACLRVVLYKDGVCGRKIESPNAGLSLARRPVQETHIFHLTETNTYTRGIPAVENYTD